MQHPVKRNLENKRLLILVLFTALATCLGFSVILRLLHHRPGYYVVVSGNGLNVEKEILQGISVNRLILEGYRAEQTGNRSGALRLYQQAIKVDPSDPGPYFMCSILYHKLGDLPNAVRMAEASLNRIGVGANVAMYVHAATVSLEVGDLDRAHTLVTIAKEGLRSLPRSTVSIVAGVRTYAIATLQTDVERLQKELSHKRHG